METPNRRSTALWVVLSSALTAAFLNLAAAVLGHPRAFVSAGELGVVLAAGFVALLACAAGVQLVAAAGARATGLARGPASLALHLAFVLVAALMTPVEVALRDASSQRVLVVLACAAGFVACAAAVSYLLAARHSESMGAERVGAESVAADGSRPATATLVLLAPFTGLVCLALIWTLEYHASAGAQRAGALIVGVLALGAGFPLSRRLPTAPILAPLGALIVGFGLHGLGGSDSGGSRSVPAEGSPPVVLITVDTLRSDHVLGSASARVPTPALDALAEQSVVFENARSAAPWTKPALATLLTGLSPLVHGMTTRRARLPNEVDTLAEHLARAGYRTGGVGLNVHLERAFRFDQGFDDYAFPARPDYGSALGAKLLALLEPGRFPEIFPSTTAIADVAIDWLDRNAGEPIFLWVHVLDPHWPYDPPDAWLERPAAQPRRWGAPAMVTNVQAGNTKPGLEERRRVAELYQGEIRYVDAEVGRILERLRELDLYDRALIVFASDHGEEFWEHGRYEHGHTLYDEVLRVPLFFKLPRARTGRRVDAAVSTESLVPTVLDALALPYDPELMSAPTLAPWWRAPESARAGPLFSTGTYYFGEKYGVIFDGKKLVIELDTLRRELYDLARDPRELRSIAAAAPELLEEGTQLVQAWQEHCARLRKRLSISGETTVETGDDIIRMMQRLGYGGE